MKIVILLNLLFFFFFIFLYLYFFIFIFLYFFIHSFLLVWRFLDRVIALSPTRTVEDNISSARFFIDTYSVTLSSANYIIIYYLRYFQCMQLKWLRLFFKSIHQLRVKLLSAQIEISIVLFKRFMFIYDILRISCKLLSPPQWIQLVDVSSSWPDKTSPSFAYLWGFSAAAEVM